MFVGPVPHADPGVSVLIVNAGGRQVALAIVVEVPGRDVFDASQVWNIAADPEGSIARAFVKDDPGEARPKSEIRSFYVP